MKSKLVRDKIPQIIESKGEKAVTYIADDEEYWSRLKDKLVEEVNEFIEDDNNIEEIADILEVIYAILDYKKISKDEVEKIRVDKFNKRGGFKDKIILEGKK